MPKECTILIVGGPRFDYVEPSVKAIEAYVEAGGRALIMLDPPLKLGRDDVSENAPLVKLLEGWGVTMDKDLVLDTSGIGQLFGLGPEVPLVTSYESHPIVREMKSVATAMPLARSLEVKGTDKVSGRASCSPLRTTVSRRRNLSSRAISINPARDKKGPLTLAAAGHVQRRPGRYAGPLRGGGLLGVGGQLHPAVQRQPRPVPEHDELAQLG